MAVYAKRHTRQLLVIQREYTSDTRLSCTAVVRTRNSTHEAKATRSSRIPGRGFENATLGFELRVGSAKLWGLW